MSSHRSRAENSESYRYRGRSPDYAVCMMNSSSPVLIRRERHTDRSSGASAHSTSSRNSVTPHRRRQKRKRYIDPAVPTRFPFGAASTTKALAKRATVYDDKGREALLHRKALYQQDAKYNNEPERPKFSGNEIHFVSFVNSVIAYLELRGIPNFFPRYLRDRRFPSRFNNERKIADREIYNLFVDWLQGASEDLATCHLDTRSGHLVFRDLVEKFLPKAVFPYTRESGLDQELKHLTFNPDQESIPHFFNRLRSIALKLRAVSTNKNENGRQSAWNGWQTEGDTNHRVLLAACSGRRTSTLRRR